MMKRGKTEGKVSPGKRTVAAFHTYLASARQYCEMQQYVLFRCNTGYRQRSKLQYFNGPAR